MKITLVRRISQALFLILFVWFCVVASVGEEWWQLRDWPVNLFLQLDPLVALGTLLTTGSLYRETAWAIATVVLTILLGRFFCGWVCPFGTLHHFMGYLGKLTRSTPEKIAMNQFHKGQVVKYYLLIFLLSGAVGSLVTRLLKTPNGRTMAFLLIAVMAVVSFRIGWKASRAVKTRWAFFSALVAAWTGAGFFVSSERILAGSLQTGLLDPIPLLHRSVHLCLLPLADSFFHQLWHTQRYYDGAWWVAILFFTFLFLNFVYPRFYCRFLCPLGALLGVLGKFALWRIGTKEPSCSRCKLCEMDCEGACDPFGKIRTSECVLCMNCLHVCKQDLIGYSLSPSKSGEMALPDLSRRKFLLSVFAGAISVPLLRLDGLLGPNWKPSVLRPPGSLPEDEFLERCLKCGQCMRVCPSNIIQPATLESGLEGMWTPVLNFRTGTSGCHPNCVACGQVCPTAAIRPIGVKERTGKKPVRIGTAFVDRNRCLPWAMDKPCIVCQENCPVSPKAIYIREGFSTIREGRLKIKNVWPDKIEIEEGGLEPGKLSSGDYHCALADTEERRAIVANTEILITFSSEQAWKKVPSSGDWIELQVHLQRPCIDVEKCIGCGICEHECPMSHRKAIYVTAENESRNGERGFLH